MDKDGGKENIQFVFDLFATLTATHKEELDITPPINLTVEEEVAFVLTKRNKSMSFPLVTILDCNILGSSFG